MNTATETDPKLYNSRFLRACRGEEVDATPVWLMRQAGRYMKEYREVRALGSFLDLCKTPERAAKVTLDAQRILGVDAAILFADLLPILEPMGFELDYLKGEGPKIFNPLREASDVDHVVVHDPNETQPFVAEAIKIIRRELPNDIPLIGFAGAPFTLASYAIEGGGSRNYIHAKRLMYSDPGAWNELLSRFSQTVITYLEMQIAAGVQAIQIFDSWVGTLSAADYRRFALPHTRKIIDAIKGRVPVIHFGVGSFHMLEAMDEAGADVLGFDWRTPIKANRSRINAVGVQGNLDPVVLFSDFDVVKAEAKTVLDDAGSAKGHIFNLGHGILPETPVDNVKGLVDFVHETTAR